MTSYLIYFFFFLLSLGQLQRIPFLGSQAFYLHEVMMFIIVLLSIGKMKFEKRSPLLIFLGTLAVSLAISLPFYSVESNMIAFLYLLRLLLYFSFFFAVKKIPKEDVRSGLIFFMLLTISFSVIQYFLFPSLFALTQFGWDPHEFRVFGTYFDVTPLGVTLTLLFFWNFLKSPLLDLSTSHSRLLHLSITLSLFFLILLTYSRITYIGFVLGCIYSIYRIIEARKLIFILMLFFLLLPILPRPSGESVRLERTYSISARVEDVKRGVALAIKHPIFGIGYNHIREFKESASHGGGAFSSSFVTIFATAGVFGLATFMYLLYTLYKRGSALQKVLVVTVASTSLFDNVFLSNFVLGIFLVLIALEGDG